MVHLLCGLPGSGKTTLAKRLASEGRGAVHFTLDEWMTHLFAIGPYDEGYGEKVERCRELIWSMAVQVLASGIDVVLDWSQWDRSRRADMAARAAGVGAEVVVHYLDVSVDEAVERIRHRNERPGNGVHVLDPDEVRRFAEEFFEPPTPDEGLPLVVER